MLDTSPGNLWAEIKAAERSRDAHLGRYTEMVEKYAGVGYRDDMNSTWSENHMYEFIRLTTGQVIFDNPRVRCKSRRPSTQRGLAMAVQHGLNRWVKDVRLRRLLKRLYVTECFGFAVAQTVIEPIKGRDPRKPNSPRLPFVYSLEPDRFFFDPLCSFYGGARYAGHKWLRDKDDLIQEAEDNPDAGWNLDAIKAISEGTGTESLKEFESSRNAGIKRKSIVGYEVWVLEVHVGDPSEGFSGTIYTIAVGQGSTNSDDKAEYLREPRPYFGPPWGPYTLFGVYPVPGDPYPLSPFSAMFLQMKDLNDISAAMSTAAKQYKRLVIYDSSNPDLGRRLKQSPDMLVAPVRGLDKDSHASLEIGGITRQHIEQKQMALSQLDRNTGLSSSHKGELTGSTATEISVANQGQTESVAFIKQEFGDATTNLLETAAWFMLYEDRVDYPLGEEATIALSAMMQQPIGEAWFKGGRPDGDFDFSDLELEIEPYSMERMNEALARAQYMDLMTLMLNASPVIPTTPFMDWKKLFDKGGEVMNDPDFGSVYSPEIAGQMMGMAMQQQAMQGQGDDPAGVSGIAHSGGGGGGGLQGNQSGGSIAAAMGAV